MPPIGPLNDYRIHFLDGNGNRFAFHDISAHSDDVALARARELASGRSAAGFELFRGTSFVCREHGT